MPPLSRKSNAYAYLSIRKAGSLTCWLGFQITLRQSRRPASLE